MKKSVAAFSVGLCLLFVAGCDDEGGGNTVADGGGNVVVDGGNTVSTSDAGSSLSDAYVPPIVSGGGVTCNPAAASFPGPDGGVMDGAARVCYFQQTANSTPMCTVLRDVAGNRMTCTNQLGVELIGVGPEFGKSTWRAKTKTDDPPRRIRSASHGVVEHDAFGASVNGLPTGTEITVTMPPSVYWTGLGPDDYVVKFRIDPPTVTIISVGRAPAPKAQ